MVPSPGLAVRLVLPQERARFDETLARQHWLGAGLVGEVMRYVAIEGGEWAALLGFGSAALCVRPLHGHLQSSGGIPSRSRARSGWRASWRVAAAMLTDR